MSQNVLRTALLAAMGVVMLPGAAHATLIGNASGSGVNFTATHSQSDTSANGVAATSSNYKMSTAALNQFDKNLGVLTGVNVGITSTYKQTTLTTVAAATQGNNSTKSDHLAQGTGSSSIKMVIPTSKSGAALQQTVSDSCALTASGPKSPCTGTASSATLNHNVAVSSQDLNAYVGAGTVNADFVAVSNSANLISNSLLGTATTTSTINWAGVINAQYSYLMHAAASFSLDSTLNELTLDFGDLYVGDVFGTQSYGIGNLAGDRVGLELINVAGAGDTDVFSTGVLGMFGNLGQGMSNQYAAAFTGNRVGSYGATYQFTLADVGPDVFASNTLFSDHALTLTLKANLLERAVPAGDVPEPGSLLLLGLGALGVSAARRRKA